MPPNSSSEFAVPNCPAKNLGEVDTVVHLVKYYYRNLEFCVITPYDAQRAEIRRQLGAEKLPCDSVYNVDSFQGVVFLFGYLAHVDCRPQEMKQNMSSCPSCARNGLGLSNL